MEVRYFSEYEQVDFTPAEIAQRQAALSENCGAYLQAWRAGEVNPGLFPYQEHAFETLLNYTYNTGRAARSQPEEPVRTGYMDEPTSFGKTALIARYLEAMKIGTLPTPDSPIPLRVLIGTRSPNAVDSMASTKDLSRGLKFFLPDLDVTTCFGAKKDMRGHAVAATYAYLLRLARQDALKRYFFDGVIADEAHDLLGPVTSQVWREYSVGKRAVGLTASPEYGKHKNLNQLFDDLIDRNDLRSLAESGDLSGVQVLGFGTGLELTSKSRGDDYNDAELEPLRRDKRRNQAICDITAQMIAEGRRGIINAMGGEKMYHPQLLAGALHGRKVTDEFGEDKVIRAASIGTHRSAKENDAILEGFKKGDYDVVVQVDKINQSFDCDEVAFIVNAAPTCSPVRAIQRVGRLMRPNAEWPIKIIIEFIDDIKGKRPLYTAWHVLGESEIRQRATVAPPDLIEQVDKEKPYWQFNFQPREITPNQSQEAAKHLTPTQTDFNELLQEMYNDFSYRLVDAFLVKSRQDRPAPPKGWTELREVVEREYSEATLGVDGIRGLLQREGGDGFCRAAHGERGTTFFVSPEGQEFLRGYTFPEQPPSRKWLTEREIATKYDLTRDTVRRCSADLQPTDYLIAHSNRIHGHFSPLQIATILRRAEELQDQEAQTKKLISAQDLATEPGVEWGAKSIHFFLVTYYGIEGRILKTGGKGADGRFYDETEADLVRRHRRHDMQPSQAELRQRRIIDLQAHSHRTREEILAAARALDLEEFVFDGRYLTPEGSFCYTELARPAIAEKILEQLRNPASALPPAPTSPAPEPPPPPPPAPKKEAPVLPPVFTDQPLSWEQRQNAVSATRPPKVMRQPKPPPQIPQSPSPPPAVASASEPSWPDVATGLGVLGIHCPSNIIPSVARRAGHRNNIKKQGRGYGASETTIADIAAFIADNVPEVKPGMETPEAVAARLGEPVERIVEIVGGLNRDLEAVSGVYRGPKDEQGHFALDRYYHAPLVKVIEERAAQPALRSPRPAGRRS